MAPKACRSGAHPATRKCGKKGVAVVDQGSGVGFGPREARGQDLVIVTTPWEIVRSTAEKRRKPRPEELAFPTKIGFGPHGWR